jgi:thiamine kinase-like enzyme
MYSADDLTTRLRSALREAVNPYAELPLQLLRDKGLAHDHVRLQGAGLLARIPKQSQLGLAAQANLEYQRACFERAAPGGYTPQLYGVLTPSIWLPRGALLVEEIAGQPAVLPANLGEIAVTLASLHTLPLPSQSARAPLLDARDPLQALYAEIDVQAAFLPGAGLVAEALRSVDFELQALAQLCRAPARPERRLIAFDGHPGNFICDAQGRAVLVDLEKCRYSYPSLDLAHATLYTSTTWDIDTHAALSAQQVLGFYAAWKRAAGPGAESAQAWHLPLRRAMWLWSITWCAKWRASSGLAAREATDGEDWSAERSDAELVAHVQERVDHYLGAEAIARVRDEFDVLGQALGT